MINDKPAHSSYLDHLPAIFQRDDEQTEGSFLGSFLLAFEAILSGGVNNANTTGLEETIAKIHTYFDPQQTPTEFLPWLSGWVALSLKDDWTEQHKRDFLRHIVPLYKMRGTKAGLRQMLSIFTGLHEDSFEITEPLPLYFQVDIKLFTLTQSQRNNYQHHSDRERRIARAIIDQYKPAHTYYAERVQLMTTMQIGHVSTIGEDTLLGSVPQSQ